MLEMGFEQEKSIFDKAAELQIAGASNTEVIELLEQIKKGDVTYDLAQYNLLLLNLTQGNFQQVKICYQQISEDSKQLKNYTKVNLGYIHQIEGKIDEAIKLYQSINRVEFHPYHYAYSNLNLYFLTKIEDYLNNIKKEDCLETYAQAQYILGNNCIDVSENKKYWDNIPEDSNFYIQKEYSLKLIKQVVEINTNYNENFREIFKIVDKLLETLFVNSIEENRISHYTNLSVSKILLKNDDNALRLNTVNLMNDPTEGSLLFEYLNIENKITTIDLAYISCFTLHHDSLNQFRLYAKQDYQEAFGVSLVLNQKFFSNTHNAAKIYTKITENTKVSLINQVDLNSIGGAINKNTSMPLYRCIYIDPCSNYIKVAQREEWSFCREDRESDSVRWKNYFKKMQIIEINVREALEDLKYKISELNNPNFPSLNILNLNELEKNLLGEILLPLRYLMKHMAFKEEQECRIVYVTQMDNPLVQYDEKINRIYIDYEPSVMEHLEKIYIAPKAKDEKMVFEYLCSRGQEIRKGKEAVKVKISQNPFR